jgi:hypothetical protein
VLAWTDFCAMRCAHAGLRRVIEVGEDPLTCPFNSIGRTGVSGATARLSTSPV